MSPSIGRSHGRLRNVSGPGCRYIAARAFRPRAVALAIARDAGVPGERSCLDDVRTARVYPCDFPRWRRGGAANPRPPLICMQLQREKDRESRTERKGEWERGARGRRGYVTVMETSRRWGAFRFTVQCFTLRSLARARFEMSRNRSPRQSGGGARCVQSR